MDAMLTNVFVHKKSGREYRVVFDGVIECTNGREELRYAIYENDEGKLFCREEKEFLMKFEPKLNIEEGGSGRI